MKMNTDREWLLKMAEKEAGCDSIGVGGHLPDTRPGIPIFPFVGIIWLVVVILAEVFIDLPNQALPPNFGTSTLQGRK